AEDGRISPIIARRSRNQTEGVPALRTMRLVRERIPRESRNAVQKFIADHQQQSSGVLSGFDRLVLRGTLRRIAHAEGMNHYLWANDILLKDFAAHVESVSHALKS